MSERAALLLDTESHALGTLPLAMSPLGLEPLYATALDELVLLSREYQSEIETVWVAVECLAECLPALRKGVLEPLGLGADALVPVGGPLSAELADGLRTDGVSFALPIPHDPEELRFVVRSLLARGAFTERRLDPRAPCRVQTRVESERDTVEGHLLDLSAGGAFVALEKPYPEGEAVLLHFELDEGRYALGARVVWRAAESEPTGMGVRFVRLEDGVRPPLEAWIATRRARLVL